MNPEASLWDYLRKLLPRNDFHYSRIESLETSPGFPDIHYTFRGTSATIELKSAKVAPIGDDRGLRKSQKDWIEDELAAGGRVILCIEVGLEIFWIEATGLYKTINGLSIETIRIVSSLQWLRYRNRGFDPVALRRFLSGDFKRSNF